MEPYGDDIEDLGAYYEGAQLTIAVPSGANTNDGVTQLICLSANTTSVKLAETARALADGAIEVPGDRTGNGDAEAAAV